MTTRASASAAALVGAESGGGAPVTLDIPIEVGALCRAVGDALAARA